MTAFRDWGKLSENSCFTGFCSEPGANNQGVNRNPFGGEKTGVPPLVIFLQFLMAPEIYLTKKSVNLSGTGKPIRHY